MQLGRACVVQVLRSEGKAGSRTRRPRRRVASTSERRRESPAELRSGMWPRLPRRTMASARSSFRREIVLRGNDLPPRLSLHPRVGKAITVNKWSTLSVPLDDQPPGYRGRRGAELVDLHVLVVRRRHRVGSFGNVVNDIVAPHQLVVFRVHELLGEELVEQRAVSLDPAGGPLILESFE